VESTKKAQVREDASFLKDLGNTPRTNTSSTTSIPAVLPQTISTPAAVPVPVLVPALTPVSAPVSAPVSVPVEAPVLAAVLPTSPPSLDISADEIAHPTSSIGELASSILASAAALQMGAIASSVTDLSEGSTEQVSKPSKPKKTVRFKNADELVSVRLIDPRPRPGDEEEEESDDDDNDNGYSGPDLGDDDSMSYHLGRGGSSSVKPVFMMTDARVLALVRGDSWRVPMEISIDQDHQVKWGERSTEKETQERRELETLSANYFQLAYIPPSPAEPDMDPVPLDSSLVKPILLDDVGVQDVLFLSVDVLFPFLTNHRATLHCKLLFREERIPQNCL